MSASRDRARKIITELRNSGNRTGAFTHVRSQELVEQLDIRVDYPELINQRSTPFCEPASIVYGLARADAGEYVQFVCNLFWHGQARLRNWHVKPCPFVLRSNAFRHLGVDAADWIPLVSIRNTEDKLLPLDFPIPGVRNKIRREGVSLAQTLKEVNDAGYTDVHPNFQRTVESLRRANHWFRKKCIVALGINDQLVTTAPSHLHKPTPHHGHRVVMMSPIQIEEHFLGADFVKITVYSWGDEKHIPPVNGKAIYHEGQTQEKLTVDQFLANYHGFVAFKY